MVPVQPLKKPPDKEAALPHGGITLSSGRHLFNEIATTEKELAEAIENVGTIYAFLSTSTLADR